MDPTTAWTIAGITLLIVVCCASGIYIARDCREAYKEDYTALA